LAHPYLFDAQSAQLWQNAFVEGTNFNRIEGAPDDVSKVAGELRLVARLPIRHLEPHVSAEKTERELEIVSRTLDGVDSVTRGYGGEPRKLTPDRIALTEPGGTEILTGGDSAIGMSAGKAWAATADRQESALGTAAVVAHEAMHLRGYRSMSVDSSGNDKPMRIGVEPRNRRSKSMHLLNEALTEELAQMALEATHDAEIAAGLTAQKQLRELAARAAERRGVPDALAERIPFLTFPQPAEILAEFNSGSGSFPERLERLWQKLDECAAAVELLSGRAKERLAFQKLRQRLSEKTGESERAVFDRFARTYFGGASLADLVRYVEGALGPGSYRTWESQINEKKR
jgi:hypothetical protein